MTLHEQWTSYGWNVFTRRGRQRLRPDRLDACQAMEDWDAGDRRPMIVIAKTTKGYWPGAVNGQLGIAEADRRLSEPSLRLQDELGLFRRAGGDLREALRRHLRGHPQRRGQRSTSERLIQFKTNIDMVMSVLDQNGLGDWLADRLVEIGDTVKDDHKLAHRRQDRSVPGRAAARRQPADGAAEARRSRIRLPARKRKSPSRCSARRARVMGARRGISEIIKWMNYVTDNRFYHLGGGPVGIDQCRAWQPVGPLRSRRPIRSARASRRRSRKRAMSRPPSAWSARAPASIPRSSPASGRCRAPMAPSRR